jgi:hypothetical protein
MMREACLAFGSMPSSWPARWVEETGINQVDAAQVLAKLADFVEEEACRTIIVLLPAVRDVHHVPVFPQPPFRLTNLPPGIRALPNPATFSVNEIVIGTATSDTLKQAWHLHGAMSLTHHGGLSRKLCTNSSSWAKPESHCLPLQACAKLCLPSAGMSFVMHS